MLYIPQTYHIIFFSTKVKQCSLHRHSLDSYPLTLLAHRASPLEVNSSQNILSSTTSPKKVDRVPNRTFFLITCLQSSYSVEISPLRDFITNSSCLIEGIKGFLKYLFEIILSISNAQQYCWALEIDRIISLLHLKSARSFYSVARRWSHRRRLDARRNPLHRRACSRSTHIH